MVWWGNICGIGVLVDGGAAFVFEEGLFYFPVVLLGANGEFEIFTGDGVPIL